MKGADNKMKEICSVIYVTKPIAFWLAASGILVQTILTTVIYASPVWVGSSNIIMLMYTLAVISIGAVGIFWLKSGNDGKIKFGSLLLIICAIMSFTTRWGLVMGSGLMVCGGALAIISIRPVLKVPRWSEIIET